jgi:hypothetical protein
MPVSKFRRAASAFGLLDPLLKRRDWSSALTVDVVRGDVARKAEICEDALEEARKLADGGARGPLLDKLVARASELLDEIDEILVTLDPTVNGQPFAIAATLHRRLECVEAAIAAQGRARGSG